MKNSFYLISVLFVVVVFCSCTKDNQDNSFNFDYPSVFKLSNTSINEHHFWRIAGTSVNTTFVPITKSDYIAIAGEFEDLTVNNMIDTVRNYLTMAKELRFLDSNKVEVHGIRLLGVSDDYVSLNYRLEDNKLTIYYEEDDITNNVFSLTIQSDGILVSYAYVHQQLTHENGPRRSPFFMEFVVNYLSENAILDHIVARYNIKPDDLIMMIQKKHAFTKQ
jgi:hypothetical protein